MKRKLALILMAMFTIAVAIIYHIFFANTLTVVNETDFVLTNVKIYKPRDGVPNIELWTGEIKANGSKNISIPTGGSDDSVIITAKWQGQELFVNGHYPAMGAGKFKFTMVKDGGWDTDIYSKLFRIIPPKNEAEPIAN